jgi:hypothetical protein
LETARGAAEQAMPEPIEHLEPDLSEYSAIIRKVDRRIAPIMFICYFLEFLDKVLINYANVMGLQQDLGMKGIEFSLIAIASLSASLWRKSRKDTFYRGSRWQWFWWLIFPAGVSSLLAWRQLRTTARSLRCASFLAAVKLPFPRRWV